MNDAIIEEHLKGRTFNWLSEYKDGFKEGAKWGYVQAKSVRCEQCRHYPNKTNSPTCNGCAFYEYLPNLFEPYQKDDV